MGRRRGVDRRCRGGSRRERGRKPRVTAWRSLRAVGGIQGHRPRPKGGTRGQPGVSWLFVGVAVGRGGCGAGDERSHLDYDVGALLHWPASNSSATPRVELALVRPLDLLERRKVLFVLFLACGVEHVGVFCMWGVVAAPQCWDLCAGSSGAPRRPLGATGAACRSEKPSASWMHAGPRPRCQAPACRGDLAACRPPPTAPGALPLRGCCLKGGGRST